MITIQNAKTLLGEIKEIQIESDEESTLDAKGKLLALPALIAPHVSFKTPEDWKAGAHAALSNGITTLFDLPNSEPPCLNQESFHTKNASIKDALQQVQIPLRYHLFIGATSDTLEEIGKVKKEVIGIHLFLGSSFGKLGDCDPQMLDRVFQIAGQDDLVVSVATTDREDTEHALAAAEKYSSQAYLLNVHTEEELAMIKDARKHGILVYAEATAQHLFPKDASPTPFLWEALCNGTIDSIGTGYAAEWSLLPLLLDAFHKGHITLERIVELTHHNLKEIYRLEKNEDLVLVDLEREANHERQVLKGWPVYTLLNGRIFPVNTWS